MIRTISATLAGIVLGATLTLPMVSYAAPGDKITICHATGSASNPYVTITVDDDGANGKGKNDHTSHPDDIIPAPAGGCPGPVVVTPTVAPTTPAPTVAPTTPAPTVAPTTPAPTVAPTTAAPSVSPTAEVTPSVTPSASVTPSVEPTTPAPTVVPTSASPTVVPTTPAPTVTPTTPAADCDVMAVGRFANYSGLPATLVVKVNGVITPFSLIAARPANLPGTFGVNATDFEFPGIVHLLDLKVGDKVSLALTNGRVTDTDEGVVRPNCGVGVEVSLDKFVGPVVPPTEKPVPPSDGTDEDFCLDGSCPGPKSDTPTVNIKPQGSDGQTVTIDGNLPYTGAGIRTLLIIGALLVLLGLFGVYSGRLRR